MTEEEFASAGGNKSLIHTDFMIGSAEMDIDGITKDGTREPVMRAGEWAFTYNLKSKRYNIPSGRHLPDGFYLQRYNR